MTTHKNLALAASVLLAASLLCACGSDTYLQVQNAGRVSKGKELEDLKRALDTGAINQQEFDKLQKIILRRSN